MIQNKKPFFSEESDVFSKYDLKLDDIIDAANTGQRGCGELLAKVNVDRFCFDKDDQCWYRFKGHHWIIDDIGQTVVSVNTVVLLFEIAQKELKRKIVHINKRILEIEDENEKLKLRNNENKIESIRKTLRSMENKLNHLIYRQQVVKFSAKGCKSLVVDGSQWDRQSWLLACSNGVINLKNGELRPGHPNDYIRSYCPTEYISSAECPQFKKFILEIFDGNLELIEFVQRVFGMALIGDSYYKQYIIIFSGQGRNGKDTLMSAVGHVLGTNIAGPINPELLLDGGKYSHRSSNGPTPALMRLRGLRIGWSSEIGEGRRFNTGIAKLLSGGSQIVARLPFGRKEMAFQQSHLIFILTNNLTHAPDYDYAFWERVINIPFSISFVENPQKRDERKFNKGILKILKTEASGILLWMIKGCLAYQNYGLNPPNLVKLATDSYRRDGDPINVFIKQMCVVEKKVFCNASVLYREYNSWAGDMEMIPLSQTAFGKQMTKRGFNRKKSHGVILYEGVGLSINKSIC